jgi:hypothetical protein
MVLSYYYIGKDITEAVQGHAVNPPDKCITNQLRLAAILMIMSFSALINAVILYI